MPEKLLRLPEVRSRVPFSRATIYRLIASGEFPKPYSLGARAVEVRKEFHSIPVPCKRRDCKP
jgi:predicted DNA-binding transcriptional regulator AlpA